MTNTELKLYDLSVLEEVLHLGNGSYAKAILFRDKERNEYVVGKFFQCSSEPTKVEAKREAKVLANLEHQNIIRILGEAVWNQSNGDDFGLILEYAPCGNLETLLLKRDIDLAWKLRVRFFIELADALDYLHNHDPNRSYIHGDLKPQNVLLGEMLVVKLADFGAVEIAKHTARASTLGVGDFKNTQHTPYYTAPEFLQNPNMAKCESMDVYSFAMIGYEILGRKTVYSGATASPGAVIGGIIAEGQKLDITILDDVRKSLEQNTSELRIFNQIKMLVEQCWQKNPGDRLKISNVKTQIKVLAQTEDVYSAATDQDAKSVAEAIKNIQKLKQQTAKTDEHIAKPKFTNRSFQSETNTKQAHKTGQHAEVKSKNKTQPEQPNEQTSKTERKTKTKVANRISQSQTLNQPNGTSAWKVSISFFGLLLAIVAYKLTNLSNPNTSSGFIAVLPSHELIEYDVHKNNISVLSNYPGTIANAEQVEQILQVGDTVYVIEDWIEHFAVLKLNLSNSSRTWEKLHWDKKYQHRNYIAFNNSILAVGNRDYNYDFTESNIATANVDLYNTATGEWTALRSMKKPRAYHTLVLFQELVCAIGGKDSGSSECYDPNTNKWRFLPPMNTERQRAAAAELNGELYVIGGALAFRKSVDKHKQLRSVEKYNRITDSWKEVAALNEKRIGHTAGVFNGKIYVIGGASDFIEAYDASKNVWENQVKINITRYTAYTAF